jgi:hypothetical protein
MRAFSVDELPVFSKEAFLPSGEIEIHRVEEQRSQDSGLVGGQVPHDLDLVAIERHHRTDPWLVGQAYQRRLSLHHTKTPNRCIRIRNLTLFRYFAIRFMGASWLRGRGVLLGSEASDNLTVEARRFPLVLWLVALAGAHGRSSFPRMILLGGAKGKMV